jgi:hypothetical protein
VNRNVLNGFGWSGNENKWRTCSVGEKVFDTIKRACVLSVLWLRAQCRNSHIKAVYNTCNNDSLLSQINNRVITLQTTAYFEYLQTIPAFVHVISLREANSVITGLDVLQRAIKHDGTHQQSLTIAPSIVIFMESYR